MTILWPYYEDYKAYVIFHFMHFRVKIIFLKAYVRLSNNLSNKSVQFWLCGLTGAQQKSFYFHSYTDNNLSFDFTSQSLKGIVQLKMKILSFIHP